MPTGEQIFIHLETSGYIKDDNIHILMLHQFHKSITSYKIQNGNDFIKSYKSQCVFDSSCCIFIEELTASFLLCFKKDLLQKWKEP